MDIRDLFVAMDNDSAARPSLAERGVITGVNGDGTVYVNCTGVGELMALADTIGSPVVGNTVVVLRTPQGPVAALRIAAPAGIPTNPPADPGAGAGLSQGTTYIPAIQSFSFEMRDWEDPTHGTTSWSRETRLRQGTDTTGLAWRARLYHVLFTADSGAQAPAEALLQGVTCANAQVRIARAIDSVAGAVTTKVSLTNGGYWPPQQGDSWGPSTPAALPDWNYDPSLTWVTPKPTTPSVDVTLNPGEFKWVTLPADWWPALLSPLTISDGTGWTGAIWCGLGLFGTTPTPEFIGPSIDQDPEQGLLRIDWTA